MRRFFVEPFELARPTARKIIVLSMILQTVMACNNQLIPFLFYRPKFYCDSPTGLQECDEVDACMEPTLKFKSDYTFSSIPLDFELYCGNKQWEATILTFHLIGHIVGAICSTWLSDLGHSQRSTMAVLLANAIVSGISCITLGLAQSPLLLCIGFFVWSFNSEMILNFLSMVPVGFFPHSMSKRIFSLLVISWSMYATIVPLFIWFHLSWRITMIWNLGAPFLVWSAYVIYNFKEFTTLDISETPENEPLKQMKTIKAKQEEIDPHAPPTEEPGAVTTGFADMYQSSHFRNILMYFIVYAGSYVATVTSILTLGSIRGNIYVNLTFVNFAEIVLCFTGGYIIHAFDVKEAIKFVYLTMAVSYSIYNFMPSIIRYLIVLEGKLLTDITWIMLNTYVVSISPKKYIPLIVATRGVTNNAVCAIMPYIKYFMEMIRLNIFIFSGVYEFVAYFSIRSVKEKDVTVDEKPGKIEG